MSKTTDEAIQELALAIGEFEVTVQYLVERLPFYNQTFNTIESLNKRLQRLNPKKHPVSPYAKFDKLRKKKRK